MFLLDSRLIASGRVRRLLAGDLWIGSGFVFATQLNGKFDFHRSLSLGLCIGKITQAVLQDP